jgi:hypothetical protein
MLGPGLENPLLHSGLTGTVVRGDAAAGDTTVQSSAAGAVPVVPAIDLICAPNSTITPTRRQRIYFYS